MTDTPPRLDVETTRQSLSERISIVWVIPLVALLIALGVAWQNWSNQGPLIEVAFENASGIEAGETELHYRDVPVGLVENIGFGPNLSDVLVRIRLDKEVAEYVDEGSAFWVVRPEVTTQGVSGLGTVLSGVYIEGDWDEEPGGLVESFRGEPSAPLVRPGEGGLQLTLRAAPGEELVGSVPILFRGVEVGRVGPARILAGSDSPVAEAFIRAPYDRLVTSSTRFWDTSGFSVSLGTSGAEIDFDSIAALLAGGITFDTVVSGGEPVPRGAEFAIYPDQASARNSVFAGDERELVEVLAIFNENVSGLSVEAPVELRGVTVGEVTRLSGIVDPERFGDNRVRLLTTLTLRPSRLGLSGDAAGPDAVYDFLEERVAEGMRARLATASILTGGLKVELAALPEAPPATLDRNAEPFPAIPTAASEIEDVAATAEGVFQRLNELRIEELLDSAISLMESANVLISDGNLRDVPEEVLALLGDIRGVASAPEVQALPGELSGLLGELQAAASDLRVILNDLNDGRAVETLLAAVNSAAEAVESAGLAFEGVPALIADLQEVAGRAREVPLEQLSDELTGLLASANEILSAEGAEELPASLTGALDELSAVLADLRQGGTIENANATLSAARDAATDVSEAAAALPSVTARIERLLAQAANTLEDYSENAALPREARQALRDIQEAADAVASLARTLQRRPDALIRGR